MFKISVSIITYNEEEHIERCIRSVLDVADEIVVVDSFSTDHTEEICSRFNARFIKNKFSGYIEQKNFSISQCTNSYILSLDADEELSDELKLSVLHAKSSGDFDGYEMSRLTNFCGRWIRHGGWYPDWKLRLWNKAMGNWGGENPHDKIIMKGGSRITRIKGDLLHYSIKNIESHIAQINKFSTIAAESKFRKNRKSNPLKIIIYPIWKFTRNYFFRFGFLDGFYGFVVCFNSAYANYLRYLKLYELNKRNKNI